MTEFTIKHLQIGHGAAFAEADVLIGSTRLRAHIDPDGNLSIDEALRDEDLRAEIGISLRNAVRARLREKWEPLDAADGRRLNAARRRALVELAADPQADPYDAAVALLRLIFDERGGRPKIVAILKQYNVNRISEIRRSEGPALLSKARAIAAKLSISAADLT
jgi:hypothetical protein